MVDLGVYVGIYKFGICRPRIFGAWGRRLHIEGRWLVRLYAAASLIPGINRPEVVVQGPLCEMDTGQISSSSQVDFIHIGNTPLQKI